MTEFHEIFKIDGSAGAVTPLGISGVLVVVYDQFAEELVYFDAMIENRVPPIRLVFRRVGII